MSRHRRTRQQACRQQRLDRTERQDRPAARRSLDPHDTGRVFPGVQHPGAQASLPDVPRVARTSGHTVRTRLLQRLVVPAASVVAVGAVTVGAALATGVGAGVSASTRPASVSAGGADQAGGADRPTPVEPAAPAAGFTSRVPSAEDVAEIAEAVRTSPFTSQVPPDGYEVAGARLAASDPSWAWIELRPTAADVDRAVGVLHEIDGRWELVQLGSFEVGCNVTPPQVRADLGLVCPPWSAPLRNT